MRFQTLHPARHQPRAARRAAPPHLGTPQGPPHAASAAPGAVRRPVHAAPPALPSAKDVSSEIGQAGTTESIDRGAHVSGQVPPSSRRPQLGCRPDHVGGLRRRVHIFPTSLVLRTRLPLRSAVPRVDQSIHAKFRVYFDDFKGVRAGSAAQSPLRRAPTTTLPPGPSEGRRYARRTRAAATESCNRRGK